MSSEASSAGADQVWRCLRTRPKCEHIAARHLRVLRNVEALSPRVRQRRPTARGLVWFVEALFPGYIFARCDWAKHQRAVLATTAVTGFVHFGENIPSISDKTIAELRETFADDDVLTVTDPLEPGDSVEVAGGPFRGAKATVTRLLPARERVAVLLDFLGTVREVEVPLLAVLGLRDARQRAFAAKRPARGKSK
jgi:transcriptional antiterminator RfaH